MGLGSTGSLVTLDAARVLAQMRQLSGRGDRDEDDYGRAAQAIARQPWGTAVCLYEEFVKFTVQHYAWYDGTEFLVIGSGYPRSPRNNVHEIAVEIGRMRAEARGQQVAPGFEPDMGCLYVDNDRGAFKAMSAAFPATDVGRPGTRIGHLCMGAADISKVLSAATGTLRMDRRTVVLLAVDHLPDAIVQSVLAELARTLAVGSHIVITNAGSHMQQVVEWWNAYRVQPAWRLREYTTLAGFVQANRLLHLIKFGGECGSWITDSPPVSSGYSFAVAEVLASR